MKDKSAPREDSYADINTISERIRSLQTGPVEVLETCLRRIERFNPTLNAFITVLADQARQQARIAEAEIRAGKWRGRLHGIPVGIKDFFDTAGVRTTAAFEGFRDRVPGKDAIGVARLKEAGAIIIGKTNMHELGMGTTGLESCFGPVKNPWNADYIPGGSSSGSAVAVATGMCYGTLDTDAVGSVRLPAACCGVVGFKGTYGMISTRGILGDQPVNPFIQWMGHAGITTRTVEDTALLLDVLAEKKKGDHFVRLLERDRTIRIGVADNFEADKETGKAFETAVEAIRGFGYATSSVAAPFGDPGMASMANIEADRRAIAGQAFRDIDVLLLPTTTTTVPPVEDAGADTDDQKLSAESTAFANYYGLPAISIPCGFDENGLPLGLQMVAKPWDEKAVLRLASHYQQATQWRMSHPPLYPGSVEI